MELKMDEELTEKFKVVKEHAGVNDDKSVIALLISKEYHRIERLKLHKVFLPNEVYDLVEKATEARGQTIDEYIQEVTEDLLNKVKTKVIPIESDVYESLKILAKTLGYSSVDAYAEKILQNIKKQEQKVQA
jgi:predicted DNA-binding protein